MIAESDAAVCLKRTTKPWNCGNWNDSVPEGPYVRGFSLRGPLGFLQLCQRRNQFHLECVPLCYEVTYQNLYHVYIYPLHQPPRTYIRIRIRLLQWEHKARKLLISRSQQTLVLPLQRHFLHYQEALMAA